MRVAASAAEVREYTKLSATEQLFLLRAREKGAKTYRAGWPDFIIEHRGKVYCVEVKHHVGDIPTAVQQSNFAVIERAGLRTFVWTPDRPGSITPWRTFCSRPKKSARRSVRYEPVVDISKWPWGKTG